MIELTYFFLKIIHTTQDVVLQFSISWPRQLQNALSLKLLLNILVLVVKQGLENNQILKNSKYSCLSRVIFKPHKLL